MKLMAPPLVDIVADEFRVELSVDNVVIVSGAAALVLLKTETAPPDVIIKEPAPSCTVGAINLNALPPVMFKVVPAARFMDPVGSVVLTPLSLLTSTSPVDPAPNV